MAESWKAWAMRRAGTGSGWSALAGWELNEGSGRRVPALSFILLFPILPSTLCVFRHVGPLQVRICERQALQTILTPAPLAYSKYVLQTAGFDGEQISPAVLLLASVLMYSVARFPNQNQTRHWFVF